MASLAFFIKSKSPRSRQPPLFHFMPIQYLKERAPCVYTGQIIRSPRSQGLFFCIFSLLSRSLIELQNDKSHLLCDNSSIRKVTCQVIFEKNSIIFSKLIAYHVTLCYNIGDFIKNRRTLSTNAREAHGAPHAKKEASKQ